MTLAQFPLVAHRPSLPVALPPQVLLALPVRRALL